MDNKVLLSEFIPLLKRSLLVGTLRVASASTSGYGMRCNRLHIYYYIEALCLHLVSEKPRKLNSRCTRDDIMVSTHMRGAVIPTSVHKGFPSTFTLRRGIQFHAFLYINTFLGTEVYKKSCYGIF